MKNTTTPASPGAVGLRYGLLVGLIMIAISFGLTVAGLEKAASWLTTAVQIGGVVMAHKFFKQHNQGFMSYGQGVGIGTLMSGVAGVLNAIYSYVFVNFIDPDFAQRILNKTRTDMEARGNMSDAQIDQGMVWAAKFVNGPLMMVSVLFVVVLTGLAVALIISIFTKNARPEFE